MAPFTPLVKTNSKISIQRSKKKSAWLILWNATNDAHLASLRRPRIVAILDHRISEKIIRQYLKLFYYSDQNLSPSSKNHEMHLHSIRRLKDAKWKDIDSGDGTLVFGSFSPWIEAKRVANLFVDIHSEDFETTYWIEKSPNGDSLNFKLETNYSNSEFVEKLHHGGNAVPSIK